MQNEIIPGLFFRISAESSVAGDIFQRAGDGVAADSQVSLQIRYRLSQQICACRNISINRQARQGFELAGSRTANGYLDALVGWIPLTGFGSAKPRRITARSATISC